MPTCSTCGYVVDYLRSCYSSRWRLFRDEVIETEGYYYFSPPGTPAFPSWHNVGSRIWTSDEREEQPALGEVDDAPHVWSNGQPRSPVPPAHLVGDADCIENGERLPLPVVNRFFLEGIDSRCWDGVPLPTGNWTQEMLNNGFDYSTSSIALLTDGNWHIAQPTPPIHPHVDLPNAGTYLVSIWGSVLYNGLAGDVVNCYFSPLLGDTPGPGIAYAHILALGLSPAEAGITEKRYFHGSFIVTVPAPTTLRLEYKATLTGGPGTLQLVGGSDQTYGVQFVQLS